MRSTSPPPDDDEWQCGGELPGVLVLVRGLRQNLSSRMSYASAVRTSWQREQGAQKSHWKQSLMFGCPQHHDRAGRLYLSLILMRQKPPYKRLNTHNTAPVTAREVLTYLHSPTKSSSNQTIRNINFRVTATNFVKVTVSKPKAPPFIFTIYKKNGKPYTSNSLHNTLENFRLFNLKVESSTH